MKAPYTQEHALGDMFVKFEGILYTQEHEPGDIFVKFEGTLYTQEHEPGDILVKFEGTRAPYTQRHDLGVFATIFL